MHIDYNDLTELQSQIYQIQAEQKIRMLDRQKAYNKLKKKYGVSGPKGAKRLLKENKAKLAKLEEKRQKLIDKITANMDKYDGLL